MFCAFSVCDLILILQFYCELKIDYILLNCKWIISWFPILLSIVLHFVNLCLSTLMKFMHLFAELQLWLKAITAVDLPNSLPLGCSHMYQCNNVTTSIKTGVFAFFWNTPKMAQREIGPKRKWPREKMAQEGNGPWSKRPREKTAQLRFKYHRVT